MSFSIMTYKKYLHDWFGLCAVGVRVDLNGMQIEPNVDNTEFELSREFYLEDTSANLKIMTVLLPFLSCMIAKVSPSLSHAIPVHCLNQRKKFWLQRAPPKLNVHVITKSTFFSMHEWPLFYKSCDLIDSRNR